MSDNNGGLIRLSWQQVVFIVGLAFALVAAWYDLRGQVASARAEIAVVRSDVARVDRRVERLEDHAK